MTRFPPFRPRFSPLQSHVLELVRPRAVGRGRGEGPQRLAGEALLLPCVDETRHVMSTRKEAELPRVSVLKDCSEAFGRVREESVFSLKASPAKRVK